MDNYETEKIAFALEGYDEVYIGIWSKEGKEVSFDANSGNIDARLHYPATEITNAGADTVGWLQGEDYEEGKFIHIPYTVEQVRDFIKANQDKTLAVDLPYMAQTIKENPIITKS
jgi:hypothetical protein